MDSSEVHSVSYHICMGRWTLHYFVLKANCGCLCEMSDKERVPTLLHLEVAILS